MLRSQKILNHVSARTGIDVATLRGPSQTHDVAHARFVAMYVMRQMLGLSYPQIAKIFRRKNHTSVLYGVRRVEARPDLKRLANAVLDNGLD